MPIKKYLFFLTLALCLSTAFSMKNNDKRYFGKKKHIACYECGTPQCYFPECGMTFKKVNDLLVHMRAKHANQKTKTCNFPNCRKTIDSLSHLKEHMNCHLGKKYFKCPNCFKTFKWLKHLIKHLKEHEKNSLYTFNPTPIIFIPKTSNAQHNDDSDSPIFHLSETLLQEDLNDQKDLKILKDLENLECLKNAEFDLSLEQCNANEHDN